MTHKRAFAILLAVVLALSLTGLALALVGDLDISGTVDSADMEILSAAYGSHSWSPISPNWDWRADINDDDRVNLTDLTLAGLNYGEPFNFHWPRRIANGRNLNPAYAITREADAAIDSQGRIHVVFSDDDKLYYTQLDAAGNATIEDVYIDNVVEDPRLAIDAQDNVHIIYHASYDPANMKDGVLYARLSPGGVFQVQPRVVLDRWFSPAIDVDSYGHAHVLARDSSGRLWYTILDERGNSLLDPTHLNTRFSNLGGGIRAAISVDSLDTRHILWYEDTEGVSGDLIYTRIPYGELPSPNQIVLSHIVSWNSRRLVIQSDSQGAAHVLWHDFKSDGSGAIYWRRVNPDGTLSAERLITTKGENSAGLSVRFVIDAHDQIHLIARDAKLNLSYARLDRDGNVLSPFRTFVYGVNHTGHLGTICVNSEGHALVVYEDYDNVFNANPLYAVTTIPDAAANDGSRADLVLDTMHAAVSPMIARIVDTARITVTLTNGGWQSANQIAIHFEETIEDTPIASAVIASLPPFSSTSVVREVPIPDLENTTLLPLRVTASTTTPETSLLNNAITLTMGIIPPAHSVDFLVEAYDETYAPNDRSLATYLYGGQLSLQVPVLGFVEEITSTRAFNAFLDVPLNQAAGGNMATSMQLSLSAPGFSSASQPITAARMDGDPYRVILTPSDPIKMYLNRWGELQGTVYSGTTSIPLANTTIKLDGSATTTSDLSGHFSFSKVVSGTHSLEAVHAGNEPTTQAVQIQTGVTATPIVRMPATTRGYVRGTVSDDLGRPMDGATVRLKSGGSTLASSVTATDGRYSFQVANALAYSSYTIEAQAALCDDYTSPAFTLVAGMPRSEDVTLSWTITAANLHTNDDVTSWLQRENWGEVHDDGISIGDLVDVLAMAFGFESFPSYEVEVGWGKYHYALGLNYSESGGVKTVESLGVDLANLVFYSYDVEGGIFHAGADSTDLTALRVERADLVILDDRGNVEQVLWQDSSLWYASSPDGTPAWETYNIQTQTTDWADTAVRIFLRVGKYDSDPSTGHWAPWHPPVSLVSLGGSGSGAGADYQSMLWRLATNEVEIMRSLAYYADVVSAPLLKDDALVFPVPGEAQDEITVSLTFPEPLPARAGAPFAVDVSLSGASASPVYALEFDLDFDPAYLRLLEVEGAPAFQGTHGTWTVIPSLEGANASGSLQDTATVRLGDSQGLAVGALARIVFYPLAVSDATAVELSGVSLAMEDGTAFSADVITGASLEVDPAQLFLPMLRR